MAACLHEKAEPMQRLLQIAEIALVAGQHTLNSHLGVADVSSIVEARKMCFWAGWQGKGGYSRGRMSRGEGLHAAGRKHTEI